MKLLIISGTGFIGRNLKEYFNKQSGITVYAPTRKELDPFDDVLCLAYIKNLKPDYILYQGSEGYYTYILQDIAISLNITNLVFSGFRNFDTFGFYLNFEQTKAPHFHQKPSRKSIEN